ncbi:wd repeat-containing protein 90 [Limosa lapponica baueri]|uniref:Wd repeat-containing protein 90 n=1 Tax=Limosa lapponica baueri TaxID=1758121 RepID=A0A2I0T3G2_LIMLA|nr:wd repeat-containing protein 90 [Limosa lapponica baueri]
MIGTALWTRNNAAVVYPCHAVIVTLQIQTGEQRFFIGHTDKVSALAFNGDSTLLASAQAGPLSVVRLWDFSTGTCLSLFKTHVRSLFSLSFVCSKSGHVLEVDYKNVCVRSVRRLLPAEPQGCPRQDRAGRRVCRQG